MGVFSETCYGVQCDGCKEVYVNTCTDFSMWVNDSDAMEDAREGDWVEINGKWYCPECVRNLFDYNEETDEYEPKAKPADQ